MATDLADNPYEKHRQELIARNRARLQALGVASAADTLQTTAKPAAKPKQKRKAKAHVSHEPSRKSSRLHPETAATPDASEEASELALCIVNEECPRCGKVLVSGHKKHLEHCTIHKRKLDPGTVEIEGLDELEDEEEQRLAAIAEDHDAARPTQRPKGAKSQAEKLKELEMSGLVDFTAEHARFAVIGSTGRHYSVELADNRHTCQCPDFRVRRRACKHIKLVLQQLGIPEESKDWHKAVAAQLDRLAAQQDNAQDERHNNTANDEAANEDANRSASAAEETEKEKKSAGAALSWPKRTKHKTGL